MTVEGTPESPELQLASPWDLLYTGMTPPTLPRISRPVRVGAVREPSLPVSPPNRPFPLAF